MVVEDGSASHDGCDGVAPDNDTDMDVATPLTEKDIDVATPLSEKDTCNGDHVLETQDTSREIESDTEVVIEADGVTRSLGVIGLQEDECEEEEKKDVSKTNELPEAPDGGYGWVICLGCFLNHMIIGGLVRSEGLFFLHFKSRFDTTAQLATWPGSLSSTLNLFMGPACAAIVNRYSVRASFLIGSLLCVLGYILTGFAPNIYFLFFSHTILGGFGRGLMTGVLLLNMYFDKHRSLATGVSMSGTGLGSLWVVPLVQFLFDYYGYTGAFLILGGLASHTFFIAMLFRPLSMHLKFTQAAEKRRARTGDATQAEEGIALTSLANGGQDQHSDEKTVEQNGQSRTLFGFQNQIPESNGSPETSATLAKVTENGLETSLTMVPSEHSSEVDGYKRMVQQKTVLSLAEDDDHKEKVLSVTSLSKREPDGCLKSSLKIIFPVEYKKKKSEKRKRAFDWTLVKHVPFMVFVLSNFLFILAFKTTLTFLPAIASSKGLTDTEAAMMLTISGALDTFGRIAIGFLMDLPRMRPLRFYAFNVLYFIIAGASLLVPFLNSFASFAVVCAVYGLMTGASMTQKLVVMVDIVGRDNLPSSLGINKVFQGFGTLIGPPLAGALRDALGSYDISFFQGGASMFGATLLLALSNILLRLRKRKAKK